MAADIIRFPSRSVATPDPAGQERLQRALASLDAALESQRKAVAEWRGSLKQLGDTMSGLRGSLQRYSGSLTKLEAQVGALNTRAVTLEQWADKTLTGQ